ncbi:MAG: hypothetical protein WC004_01495 [Candidatus Absconditabacterales bacterium]
MILSDNKAILFYECMSYPLPSQEVLHYLERSEKDQDGVIWSDFHYEPDACGLYSRDDPKPPILSDYIDHIQSFDWLRRSLPFVQHIYLANSITFNALHDRSDIDLFIVASDGRLWLARARSWVMLNLFGLYRQGRFTSKRFCLSFYVEQKHSNLYPIAIQPLDIYLLFRIAHLVPLYSVHQKEQDHIWKANKWIKSYFPHHPLKQLIRLGVTPVFGNTLFKDTIEKLFTGLAGDFWCWVIASIWNPIHRLRQHSLGKKARGIVINKYMLKFHLDRRKEYLLRYMNKLKTRKIL